MADPALARRHKVHYGHDVVAKGSFVTAKDIKAIATRTRRLICMDLASLHAEQLGVEPSELHRAIPGYPTFTAMITDGPW